MVPVKLLAIPLLAALLPFAFAGCVGGGDDEAGETVELNDNSFDPDSLSLAAGTAVEFENEGQRQHTVTIHKPPAAATEYAKNTVLGPGDDTSFTFEQPGTYHVFCRFHGRIGGGMHLNVTVS